MKIRGRTLLTLLTALTAVTVAAWGQTVPVMQSSFTGGEMSPLAAARVDSERYYTSVSTMTNLIAVPQGPAVRRPGTRFVAATDSNNVARLLPFRYSADDSYILEFTDSLMRVMRDHGVVTNDDDSLYSLATPFDANELAHLQMVQFADDCYLVDGTDWPQKLARVDHNDWSIADAVIDDGPFLTENLTATTIAASAVTGEDVNLVASTPIFQAGHVGSYWRLRDLVEIQTASGTLTEVDANSTDLTCQAGNQFQWSVSGSFVGTVELRMSYDSGASWAAYSVISSTSVISNTDEEVYDNDTGQDVLLEVRCTEYTSGTCKYKLWVHAYMHTGVVHVTDYNDPCNVVCDVVRTLASTDATVRWSEGAWSAVQGYPRAIATYNDRMVLASTTLKPLTIWFSATGEYESFDVGQGNDADSFGYLMGRSEQDPILWLTPQRKRGLIVGTSGSIFEISPMDSGQGITPSNPPTITETLSVPCADIPPILADNILLALQRQGRKLREVLYSYDADTLVAPDLTMMSDHLTVGGMTELAWSNQPYPVLWAVRADGTLLSMVYDRNYQIVAWSTHTLGGSGAVESLCVIPSADEDELWLSVRRTIDGSTVRYVEYLSPWSWGTDANDCHFVDCGLVYDSTAATTFSGLDHIEGQTASILADGSPVADQAVVSGDVVLDWSASVVHVGLPYTSTLTTVRYDFAGQQGVTWHRAKTVRRATVSFYQTSGAALRLAGGSNLYRPDWQGGSTGLLTAGTAELFTGDKEFAPETAYAPDAAALTIVQDQPLPMTVRAIVALVEIR
jgi:hypothetical protein